MFVGEDVAVAGDDHPGAGSAAGGALAEEVGGTNFGDDGDDAGCDLISNIGDGAFLELNCITIGAAVVEGNGVVAAEEIDDVKTEAGE